MVHVPYLSAGLSVTALMENETQLQFVSPSSSLHYIKAGRMRVLAYNNPKRADFLPEVSAMAEAGLPGTVIHGSWYCVFAPPRSASLRCVSAAGIEPQ